MGNARRVFGYIVTAIYIIVALATCAEAQEGTCMAGYKTIQTVDMNSAGPIPVRRFLGKTGDALAHTWEVIVTRDNAPETLTGYSAAVVLLRDDGDVPCTATITANKISATFPGGFYARAGSYHMIMWKSSASTGENTPIAEAWLDVGEGESGIVIDYADTYTLAELTANEAARVAAENQRAAFYAGYNAQLDSVQAQIDVLVVDGDSSVEAAQARVNAAGTAFATLKARLDDSDARLIQGVPRNIIMVGDSYATFNGGDITAPYPELVQEYLGLDNDHFHIARLSGQGFVNGGFLSLLQGVEVDDPKLVTDIYVFGGWNDAYETESAVLIASAAFADYARETFPNATLHLGFISATVDTNAVDGSTTMLALLENAYVSYAHSAARSGFAFVQNTRHILHDKTMFLADGAHPNQAGAYALGLYLAMAMQSGACEVHYKKESAVSSSTFTLSDPLSIVADVRGDLTTILAYTTASAMNASYAAPTGYTFNGTAASAIEIGSINNSLINGFTQYCSARVTCKFFTADAVYDIACVAYVRSGSLWIRPDWTFANRTTVLTLTLVAISVPSFKIECDSKYA